MSLPFQTIGFKQFGGGNWNDPPDALVGRSHEQIDGGFVQRFPAESPNLLNVDFIDSAMGKRLGSAVLDDLTAVLLASDTLIGQAFEWTAPGGNTRHQIQASAKTIYVDPGGGFAQMTGPDGTTAFTWATDITKCTVAPVDNHLHFLNDKNPIVVYRTGGTLDEQLRNSTTTTTVDADSASGQKVLNVAATTSFRIYDRIDIDPTGVGGGQEFGFIVTIQAGISVTLLANLTNTHIAVQADTVQVANRYTESFGGAQQTVTGSWQDGTYVGFSLHQRLCMSTSDSVLEFSDVGQPWDLAGGGFHQANGNIVAALPFLPRGISELNAVGFLSTTAGPEFVSGFDLSDTIKPLGIGGTALSYRALVPIGNWIVYMNTDGGIEGVNFNEVIDLGRRFVNGTDGPLDTLTTTNTDHDALTFGFKTPDSKQVGWFYPDASGTVVSHAVLLDFFLGEPRPGETEQAFERHVRPLYWSIKESATNPWFVGAYNKRGVLVGILASGKTYTINSGQNDLDTLPVLDHWEMPDFDGGFPERKIGWRELTGLFATKGTHSVTGRTFTNRDAAATGNDFTWQQADDDAELWGVVNWGAFNWAGGGQIVRTHWIELVSHALRIRLLNQQTTEPWVLNSLTLKYQVLN